MFSPRNAKRQHVPLLKMKLIQTDHKNVWHLQCSKDKVYRFVEELSRGIFYRVWIRDKEPFELFRSREFPNSTDYLVYCFDWDQILLTELHSVWHRYKNKIEQLWTVFITMGYLWMKQWEAERTQRRLRTAPSHTHLMSPSLFLTPMRAIP